MDRGADFSGIHDINDPKNIEGMCPMIWAVTFNERKIAAELLRLSSKYVLHYPVVIERCLSIKSGNVTYYEDIFGEDENMFHLKNTAIVFFSDHLQQVSVNSFKKAHE